jgi:copper chaperone
MVIKELLIEGMSCQHCVMHVKNGLERVPGIKIHDVQMGKARIEYDESTVNEKTLADAVEETGYSLKAIQ